MDALIIYPENKQQLIALKAVMKAMNIAFEQKKAIYPEHILNGVHESLKQTEKGEITPYSGIKSMMA